MSGLAVDFHDVFTVLLRYILNLLYPKAPLFLFFLKIRINLCKIQQMFHKIIINLTILNHENDDSTKCHQATKQSY